jgi:protein arginine kinase
MKKTINSKERTGLEVSEQAGVETLLTNTPAWITAKSDVSTIILSTRIRLARNLRACLFPSKADDIQLQRVIETTEQACSQIKMLRKALFIRMEDMDDVDEKLLVERRLVSPIFASASHPRMIVVDKKEFVSIMVNEEDHLRLQSIQAGLAFQAAWQLVSLLDDELSEKLEYAFCSNFGYLTSCPTNTGTGMRASIQIHLPALSFTNEINRIVKELAPSEIAVRGYYGEGSEIMGNIYQISNQLTLGRTENAIINHLEKVSQKFIHAELKARDRLLKKERHLLEDKIYRALGILQNARVMSSQELLHYLSMVRLGMDFEWINGIEAETFNELMLITQPAHMQKMHHKKYDAEQRDRLRAEIIRRKFIQSC